MHVANGTKGSRLWFSEIIFVLQKRFVDVFRKAHEVRNHNTARCT